MKSKTKKRLVAFMLCMVLVLSSTISAFADELQDTDSQNQIETMADPATDSAIADEPMAESLDASQEEQQSVVEQPVQEEVQTPEETPVVETPAEPAVENTAPAENEDVKADEPAVNETQPILQLTYEDDNVKVTVDAVDAGNIPDGASLSVTPIIKKEITDSMSDEEKEETKAMNDQYDHTEKKLQEKAKDEPYDIAGFLAYDITFVDPDRNKLEPNGDVKVSMEYKKAEIPEEAKKVQEKKNKDQKLDVTVMHLEEDERGEVKEVVDMVADENETAEVETTSAMKVKKAEFVTDSFSVFTLTWSKSSYSSTLSIKVVDNNGKEIGSNSSYTFSTGDITENGWSPTGESESLELSTIQNNVNVANYTYSRATLDSADGNTVTYVKCKMQSSYWDGTTYTWQYSDNGSTWKDLTGHQIYFVYTHNTSLAITDDIVNTGALKAEYTAADGSTTTIVSTKWYRSDSENGTYTEVEKINYQGDKTNLSTDGRELYPAFDNGARKWYKVKATLSDGTEVEAGPVQVAYYNQLQNGSFETPKYNTGMNQVSNESYAQGNGVWQTTGTGTGDKLNKDIEILTNGNYLKTYYAWNKSSYSDGHDASNAAYEGSQFAELNCEAAGALYQDVLTQEGTPLNYWLSHRARGKDSASTAQYDTMFLVIMPTRIAEEKKLDNQTNLEAYLTELGLQSQYKTKYSAEGQEQIYNQNGVKVLRVTSSNWNWHSLSETNAYTPTSSLTRFFFMSGDTAANDNTVGNFLDQVGFSQTLPPVADDEFSIQIEKKFRGLGNKDVNKVKDAIQFEITATKAGKELNEDEIRDLFGTNVISGADMVQTADGTLVYTIANKRIGISDSYRVTITEKNADLDGYKLEASAQTKVSEKNGEPTTTEGSIIDELKGKVTATVTFTNSYEAANYKKVNFTKVWDDNGNSFGTRPNSLDVTLHASIVVAEDGTTVEKTLDNLTQTVSLTSDNAASDNTWTYSWDVPVYYEYNGVKVDIRYRVTEGEINSDYVYESPTNGTAVAGDGNGHSYTNFDDVKTSGDASTTAKGAAVKKRAYNISLKTSELLANPTSLLANDEEKSDLGEPAHNKYIGYNASTGEYTLNLDVTGAKGNAPGVDVLFVIDTSGSMDDEYSNRWPYNKISDGLLTKLKNLLTEQGGIVDQIFAKEGNVNSVAFVSFAGMDETTTTSWYQSSGKASFKQQINALNATGGTNWTYAMMKASDVLSQKNSSTNEKVVIFLSDGKPTYSVGANGKQIGNGYASNTQDSYYTDAVSKVTKSTALRSAQMYSVYLTSDTKSGMEKFSNNLSNSDLVNGTNLSAALTEILSKVIPTYKNVVITDTLSEYVEFTESVPTITVTKKNAAGTVVLDSSQYSATVTGKQVSVELLDGASLEDGATYTISFKVKPSEAANSYYDNHNGAYPHTGDAGTGSTSAGEKGFYSNDSSRTKVVYEIDGTTIGSRSATYPQPVVQVTTHKLSYEKIWNEPEGVERSTDTVKLTVTYTDGTQNDDDITLTAPDYKYEESVPISKNIASVSEETVEGYTPSYNITDNGTRAVVTNSYSKVTSSSIKVIKKWEGNGPETPIRVSLWQSADNGSAVQYGKTITLSDDNNWQYMWDKLPTQEGNGSSVIHYTYAVREENIPANYASNITYDYGSDMPTATITNVYDPHCVDENYYVVNVLQKEQWTMNKIWQDEVDNSSRPENLEVTVNDMTFTLSGIGNTWSKTVTVLKKKNATYEANEKLTSDSYEQVSKVLNTSDSGMDVTFVNKLKTKSITVHKEWNDGDITTRPEGIQFKLLYRTGNSGNFTQYGDEIYTITKEDRDNGTPWIKVIHNLPVKYEYKVEEIPDSENEYQYRTDVTSSGDAFTITNTLKWSAVKTSESWDSSDTTSVELAGAEFELKQGNNTIATGESGSKGKITWTLSEYANTNNISLDKLHGSYTIHETKAPEGYMLHETDWTLTFENGLLTKLDNSDVKGTAENGVVINLTNKKVYDLPSTGGSGIYLYMIGGVLLMFAAAWILYKNKCREVLKR